MIKVCHETENIDYNSTERRIDICFVKEKILGHQNIYHYDHGTYTHMEHKNGNISLTSLMTKK